MSTHCLLASKVSDEKSGNNLIEDTFCMTTHFSLPAFKILYLCKLNAGEGVEQKNLPTLGRNVNWCSHYGEQYGVSLKN